MFTDRTAVVSFNARGISGYIQFIELDENSTRIRVNLQGLRGKLMIMHMLSIRPDLLKVLLLEPSGSKFFHFQKFDHVIELMHMRTWLQHRSLVCVSA